MRMRRTHVIVLIVLAVVVCGIALRSVLRGVAVSAVQTVAGRHTIAERVEQYGPAVRARLVSEFARAGIAYPPRAVVLAGLKREKQLEAWVSADGSAFRRLKSYPILAASGTLGPKLREGDRQVPEGIYAVESLNPNSLYHLALRVGYPNAFDREKARADGRTRLGGDIMIHGKSSSIGCLAMGDSAAEELFVLAAEAGVENVAVVLSPVDFRVRELPDGRPPAPGWTAELYAQIKARLMKLDEAGAGR